MNIFQGGFLGLDNIGVFDRSAPLPDGGHLEQSDGTSWMAMYTLNLLAIAFELAKDDPAYEDVASKFWEHFLYIANAMSRGRDGHSLWNDADGFFYDILQAADGERIPVRVRSMVGLVPLFAVETMDSELLARMPSCKRRMEWFIQNRCDLTGNIACMQTTGEGERRLFSIVDEDKLRRILRYMLDENEFLSPFGMRALSKYHEEHPYVLNLGGMEHRVDYEPGESRTGMFGGNSNWRGPIWFPMNFLLVEALQRFHYYYYFDSHFKVECPTGIWSLSDVVGGSGRAFSTASVHLRQVARWPQARLWRRFEVSIGRTLARFDSLLRVFSRRHGRRHGSESPDRLDRAGHETDSAEWSQRAKPGGHRRGSGCGLSS
jgi:hypothetical protein